MLNDSRVITKLEVVEAGAALEELGELLELGGEGLASSRRCSPPGRAFALAASFMSVLERLDVGSGD